MAETESSLPSQPTMGLEAVALCIAQALHESNAGFLPRLRVHVDDWYRRLNDRGDDQAASMVFLFRRALEDKELFPKWSQ